MASPDREGHSPDTMACLARKRKLSSFVPVAPVALPVSTEGEGENASFLDCKVIEGTPQTVGANNQTAGVNNCTPMRVSPFVQPTNERSAPREFDNCREGGISTELALRMLAALEGINTKLDSRLPPPGSFAGSTETPAYGPTGTVPHRAPEGSATMQQPYSVSRAPQSSATVQPPPAAARAPVDSASVPLMNPPPLSTGRVPADNEPHPPGRSSAHQGQRSRVATHTFVGFSSLLISPTPLNDPGTAPLLRPHQGISMSWDSEAVFAASTPGYHARSRGPSTFAPQMTPTPREHNRQAPPVMMATPWTVGTNVFAYDAGNRDKSTAQGPRKLPENLPKLALNGDSYDFAMKMARALQARRYNLDEWGAEAVLLSVDQRYADAMMHAL
ncbi:hypothetical protein H4S08_004782 [Coemansia sp. RSA 1365]|nr:hypothetical protein H4S08_004782 [Coemansia sp. RSA 1365]